MFCHIFSALVFSERIHGEIQPSPTCYSEWEGTLLLSFSLQLNCKKVNITWSSMKCLTATSIKANIHRVQFLLSSLTPRVQTALSTHLMKHPRGGHSYMHSLKGKHKFFLNCILLAQQFFLGKKQCILNPDGNTAVWIVAVLRTSLFKINTPVPECKNNVVTHCKSNFSCDNRGLGIMA